MYTQAPDTLPHKATRTAAVLAPSDIYFAINISGVKLSCVSEIWCCFTHFKGWRESRKCVHAVKEISFMTLEENLPYLHKIVV